MRAKLTKLLILGVFFAAFALSVSADFDYRYSSIIVSGSSTETVSYSVENTMDAERYINLSLSGVNARLDDGSAYSYALYQPGEEKNFLIVLDPDESQSGKKYINATETYTEIGYSRSESFPVYLRNTGGLSEVREVPGPGIIELATLVMLAGFLYSVQL